MGGIKDLRQRERWLAQHPEDATPADVVAMAQSLVRMRDAVHEHAKAEPGTVVVVVTVHLGARETYRLGVTAPSMDDDRVAALTANLVSRLTGGGEE